MTDYTLLVLCALADQPDVLTPQSTLAKLLHIQPATLKKTLRLLTQSGLVQSTRGAAGGYQLSKPLSEISLLELLNATEGPLNISRCTHHAKPCCFSGNCRIQAPFQAIQKQLHAFLETIQLSTFISHEASQ